MVDGEYNMQPEEQALIEYQAELDRMELSSRIAEMEENGLYVRNLLNHINDKLIQPTVSKVMPAVTLAMSTAGAIGTVALGALYLIMKLR